MNKQAYRNRDLVFKERTKPKTFYNIQKQPFMYRLGVEKDLQSKSVEELNKLLIEAKDVPRLKLIIKRELRNRLPKQNIKTVSIKNASGKTVINKSL